MSQETKTVVDGKLKEIQNTVVVEKQKILELSIKRTLDGLCVKVKSKLLEDYFKGLYPDEYKFRMKGGDKIFKAYYSNTNTLQFGNIGLKTFYTDYTDLFYNCQLNYVFLLIKGLSEGIEIIYKYPISRTDLLTMAKTIKQVALYINETHNKAIQITSTVENTIITEEVPKTN